MKSEHVTTKNINFALKMFELDAPIAQRAGENLNIEAINAYLKSQDANVGSITEVAQFAGGYSNLTYSVKLGETLGVLRRPPVGAKNIARGHDVVREFGILQALKNAGFTKMPQPLLLCTDETIIGAPFYIMQRVEGIILRPLNTKKIAQTINADTFQKISEALCDALVELHAVDIYATDLIKIGKPEGYILRQIEGWHKRYQASETEKITREDEIYAWLVKNLPIEQSPVLLHNDFKYDNVVLNAKNIFQIDAFLDWEMTTVGDARMDVGTALSYWSESTDDAFAKSFNITWLPGNLTRQQFAQRYAEKSGRDLSNIVYFYVFGLFKNAVVMQQIYKRFTLGTTTDARFAQLIQGVHALLLRAENAINKNAL